MGGPGISGFGGNVSQGMGGGPSLQQQALGKGVSGAGSQLGQIMQDMGKTTQGPIVTNMPQISVMPNASPTPQMAQGAQNPQSPQQARPVSPKFAGAANQAQQGQPQSQGGLGGNAVAPVSQPTFNSPVQAPQMALPQSPAGQVMSGVQGMVSPFSNMYQYMMQKNYNQPQ